MLRSFVEFVEFNTINSASRIFFELGTVLRLEKSVAKVLFRGGGGTPGPQCTIHNPPTASFNNTHLQCTTPLLVTKTHFLPGQPSHHAPGTGVCMPQGVFSPCTHCVRLCICPTMIGSGDSSSSSSSSSRHLLEGSSLQP